MKASPMLCPSCASPIAFQGHKLGPFHFGEERTHPCGYCGRLIGRKEATLMGETFGYWFDHFRHQLHDTLVYLPALPHTEAVEVLDIRQFDDEIHQLHSAEELVHYAAHVYRPVLRDKALGLTDAELILAPLRHKAALKAAAVYGHTGGKRHSEAWVLLIVRLDRGELLTHLAATAATGLASVIKNHYAHLELAPLTGATITPPQGPGAGATL